MKKTLTSLFKRDTIVLKWKKIEQSFRTRFNNLKIMFNSWNISEMITMNNINILSLLIRRLLIE